MDRNPRILIVGVGALGSAAAALLCRRGDLVLMDFDIVQEQNLERQTLYTKDDVGKDKVIAAAERLKEEFPGCVVDARCEMFSPDTMVRQIDIIVDGTDSLHARMVLNDVARKQGIPLVIGTAAEGRGYVFPVIGSPCWQCIMRGKIPVDDCTTGILGPTISAVAGLQARLAGQILSGETIEQKLFRLDDGARMSLAVARNPACAACSGRYEYLEEPFHVKYCVSTGQVQVRPTRTRKVELGAIRATHEVVEDYGRAVRIAFSSGTALVHEHGLIECTRITEDEARSLARNILDQA